ncbi:hypothetical protein pdam_00011218, partial [Pocillopora damicornis]
MEVWILSLSCCWKNDAIRVIVSALTRGLESVVKGVGNGFLRLLEVRSWEFFQVSPTAGSVISFFGQNAWLLIMEVAIFMVQRF